MEPIRIRKQGRRAFTYAIFRPDESTIDFGQGLKARQSVTEVSVTDTAVTFTQPRTGSRSSWERV